jgi:hypothetical protein
MSGALNPRSRMLGLMLAAMSIAVPATSEAHHSETIRAWKRTWHGPNPFATPLRGYYIPRFLGRCDREAYAAGWNCATNAGCATPDAIQVGGYGPTSPWMYPPQAGIGFDPLQFERLGHIPNDFGLAGEQPAGAATRPAR